MKTIWCIFSVDNNYDQPDNNLVAWFENKPSIETLLKHFNVQLGDNEEMVKVVQIWSGGSSRIGNTDYRLNEVGEGFLN